MSTLGGLLVAVLLAISWPPGEPPRPAADPSRHDAPSTPRTVAGDASWYPAAGRVGAADRRLQRFLGRGWLGSRVLVCRTSRTAEACVAVRLVTSCGCPGRRLVDLSPAAFRVLAPQSVGVVPVRISRLRVPALPATDVAP